MAQEIPIPKRQKEIARQHYYQQRLLLTRENLQGYVDLGKFCQQNGLYTEALDLYRKVLTLPNLSLSAKQNVTGLIRVTEENGAIALYNRALDAWQKDHNFEVAQQQLEQLFVRYPATQISRKAESFLQDMKKEAQKQKELEVFEKKLASHQTENFLILSPTKRLSKKVGNLVELKRTEIIERFGFLIFPKWTQAKAKVLIFPSRETFLKYAFSQEWSGAWTWQVLQENAQGEKQVTQRAIYTFAQIPDLESSVIPHEVTHLVFREFFGFSANIPRWLDEGVALWMEQKRPLEMQQVVRVSSAKGELIPIELYLRIKEYPRNPLLFYAQAYSLVDYLTTRYGVSKFIKFIKLLSIEIPLEEAFLQAYSDEFLDLADFELSWHDWLLNRPS